MPRGQYNKRVSSHHTDLVMEPIEETQEWSAPPAIDVRAAIQPLLTIARLAERVSTRYLAGKMGLALENDARAIREAWDTLPDEIRVML